jgi:hypothetical protein
MSEPINDPGNAVKRRQAIEVSPDKSGDKRSDGDSLYRLGAVRHTIKKA